MVDHFEAARSLVKIYESCLSALNGALHVYLDDPNAMSRREFVNFQNKATEIASLSFTDMQNKLKALTELVQREARLKAYTDANIEAPRISVVSPDTSIIDEMIKQEFVNAVMSGLRLARKMMAQHSMLVAAGTTPASARIRIRERNRGDILKVYSMDKSGRKVRPDWAVFIKLSAFLNRTSYYAYMEQAAELGFRRFVIVQPGHRRDGILFDLDDIPEAELHPQSRATIRLVTED